MATSRKKKWLYTLYVFIGFIVATIILMNLGFQSPSGRVPYVGLVAAIIIAQIWFSGRRSKKKEEENDSKTSV